MSTGMMYRQMIMGWHTVSRFLPVWLSDFQF